MMDDEAAVHGDFTENPERDCSVYFGKKPVKSLLKKNKLLTQSEAPNALKQNFRKFAENSNLEKTVQTLIAVA